MDKVKAALLPVSGLLLTILGWAEAQNLESVADINWGSIGFLLVLAGWLAAFVGKTPKEIKQLKNNKGL